MYRNNIAIRMFVVLRIPGTVLFLVLYIYYLKHTDVPGSNGCFYFFLDKNINVSIVKYHHDVKKGIEVQQTNHCL